MNPTEESAYWDWVAADYRRIEAEVYSDMDTESCLAIIESAIRPTPGDTILELGCGVGRLAGPLTTRYAECRVVGVDSSPTMIAVARDAWPALQLIENDGRTLPFADKSIDAAYSMTVFQHIPHEAQQGYLREMGRVLVPGGVLLLQFVTESEPGPLNYPTPIKTMLGWCDKAGLRDVKVDIGLLNQEWCWLTLRR